MYLFTVSLPMWYHFVLVSPINHVLQPMKMSSQIMRLLSYTLPQSAIAFCISDNKMLLNCTNMLLICFVLKKITIRKVQGMPKSQAAANPWDQEEVRRANMKACKINKQIQEKHIDQLSLLPNQVIRMLKGLKKKQQQQNTRTKSVTLIYKTRRSLKHNHTNPFNR